MGRSVSKPHAMLGLTVGRTFRVMLPIWMHLPTCVLHVEVFRSTIFDLQVDLHIGARSIHGGGVATIIEASGVQRPCRASR